MSKKQDNYICLTVFSENASAISRKEFDTIDHLDYIKIDIETGCGDFKKLVNIRVVDEDDKTILEFLINNTNARYIYNYLESYLTITTD
jgi:hypothetical protein